MVMQEGYTKEVDEKKTELQTKVVEVYESSATEIKEEEQRIKHHKGHVVGIRDGGNNICFGKYVLQASEPSRITSRQIEAGRKALQLNVRRGGAKGRKVWVHVFPWKAVTSKPNEVRMGRGKGVISYRCAPVQKGQIDPYVHDKLATTRFTKFVAMKLS
ncbi:ribosomal protein L16 [Tanacetum coccineum]